MSEWVSECVRVYVCKGRRLPASLLLGPFPKASVQYLVCISRDTTGRYSVPMVCTLCSRLTD